MMLTVQEQSTDYFLQSPMRCQNSDSRGGKSAEHELKIILADPCSVPELHKRRCASNLGQLKDFGQLVYRQFDGDVQHLCWTCSSHCVVMHFKSLQSIHYKDIQCLEKTQTGDTDG